MLNRPRGYRKPFLARINGICKKFGFQREFCHAKYGRVVNSNFQFTYWDITMGVFEYRSWLVNDSPLLLREGFFIVIGSGVYEAKREDVTDFFKIKSDGEEAPF